MNSPLQHVTLEPKSPAQTSVIWLHGLGADGHDFEPIVGELGLPKDHQVRFIFPHAPIRPITINGGMEMRGWYDVLDQGLDRQVDEAGIRQSADAVSSLIDQEIAGGIDSTKIILAGFSQGGAIALHLGLRYAARLGGIMALSTYLPLDDTLPAEAAPVQKGIAIFVAHGEHDPLVPAALGRRAAQTLEAAGYQVEFNAYPIQHSVSLAEIKDIGRWLNTLIYG